MDLSNNLTTNRFADRTFNSAKEFQDLNNEFNKLAENNLLFPEEWILRLQNFYSAEYVDYTVIEPIINEALFDFYSEEFFNNIQKYIQAVYECQMRPFNRCMNYRYFKQLKKFCFYSVGNVNLCPLFEEELSFPHSKLDEILSLYFELSISPLSNKLIQKIERNKVIYKKISALEKEGNSEKWFKALIEFGEMRFIIQNVETQISKKPLDKNLWILYIRYLKFINQYEAANEVYYRYCRVFINDKILESEFPKNNFQPQDPNSKKGFLYRMKFKNVQAFPPPPLLTLNPDKEWNFYFHDYHNGHNSNSNLSYLQYFQQKLLQFLPFYPKRKSIKFSAILPSQNFKIRSTLLQYLIKNASPEVMSKLYESCKYFFHRKKVPICYSLCFGGDEMVCKYLKNSLHLNESTFNRFKDLWIQQSLNIQENLENPTLLSKVILPKLSSCSIRYLLIKSEQNISTSDFQFLTHAKRIICFRWAHGSITEENGNPIVLEEMLAALPNATTILTKIKTTFNPILSIDSMELIPHIQNLRLLLPDNLIDVDPKDFANFILNRITPNSNTKLYFPPTFSNDFKQHFSSQFYKFSGNHNIKFR